MKPDTTQPREQAAEKIDQLIASWFGSEDFTGLFNLERLRAFATACAATVAAPEAPTDPDDEIISMTRRQYQTDRNECFRLGEIEGRESVGASTGAASDWLPTAANVNALPEPVRRFVHDLAARCDPAGDVAALTGLRDQLDGVQIMYRKAADALEEVCGCFHAAEVEGLADALANTTDEHLKDLVERRLMHALYAAQEADTQQVPVAVPEAPALNGMRILVDPTMPPNTMRLESGEHSVTMINIGFDASTGAAPEAPASEQQAPDMRDAYVGAREDLATWKKRALEAEESCRRLTAALNADNGPVFMGEPVTHAATTASASTDECFYTFSKPDGWVNLGNPGQTWEEWTRGQGIPTTKGWKVSGRAPAPNRNAAPTVIKTWRERCGDTGPTPSLDQAARAMKAEIAELRAALTQQSAAQAPNQEAAKAVQVFTCIGKGGEYEVIGYSNGAGPKRGESIVVYRRAGEDEILYHRSADDFRARMQWQGARAAQASHAGADAEIIAAVRKLVKAKGRFHTEQNYKALADALSNYDAAMSAATEQGAKP